MRCRAAISIVLAALGFSSCGGSGSKSTSISSSPGPTGSSGPSSTARAPDRSASRSNQASNGSSTRSRVAAFDLSTVKVSFLEKSFFGAKSEVVYFIARSAGRESPLAQAKACVAQSLRKAPSAYCFAFSSERALRFSRISRRPPAKMKRPCWVAYWGKPSGRRPIGSASNPAAAPLHCPDPTG